MSTNNLLSNLEFQIAFGAVRHFGRNLYTTNPPAIAELVANAWDAYAKKCDLCYTNNSLLIVDNGIGMNDEEFQKRYATSGKPKDTNIRKPEDMTLRPYMGKKVLENFLRLVLPMNIFFSPRAILIIFGKKSY